MKWLAVLMFGVVGVACAPTPPPPPPEEPVTIETSWEDGPDSCWTATGCPEVTCLALGCPGQPPELPSDQCTSNSMNDCLPPGSTIPFDN